MYKFALKMNSNINDKILHKHNIKWKNHSLEGQRYRIILFTNTNQRKFRKIAIFRLYRSKEGFTKAAGYQ